MWLNLRFNDGSFEKGFGNFHIDLISAKLDKIYTEIETSLPPNPEIPVFYQRWKEQYELLLNHPRGFKHSQVTKISKKDCYDSAQRLRTQLHQWIHPIQSKLEQALPQNPQSEIRLVIHTEKIASLATKDIIHRLPWQEWDFLTQKFSCELAVCFHSSVASTTTSEESSTSGKIRRARIISIFGDSTNIDNSADKELLEKLKKRSAELIVLTEPNRSDFNTLWQEPCDILFFAGHSETQGDGQTGVISINPNDSLSLAEIKRTLRAAINKGLKLAIFSSCDGLGLARQLADLNLPYIIVWREEVPDKLAQKFLQYFLSSFSQGESLFNSVRQARDKLSELADDKDIEKRLPGVSWLPIICQNRTELPPSWEDLGGISGELPECPYQGLSAFRQENADFFFGREKFIASLVEAVNSNPLVPVVGASGSGKSSVVFAGLIPRLQAAGNVEIISFRPGKNPFDALAVALSKYCKSVVQGQTEASGEIASRLAELKFEVNLRHDETVLRHFIENIINSSGYRRLVLVADQFEELYTLATQEERHSFLNVLLLAVRYVRAFTLVLTLRADFLGIVLDDQSMGKALQQYPPLLLTPMDSEELRDAIEKPALKMKVELEEGLTSKLINDVGNHPGRLPLLEFALALLWSKQKNWYLTHKAYEEIGGLEKALAKHADEALKNLSEEEKQQAERVFIQLVRPGEGTEDTKRVAIRTEVGEENWGLVQRLADQRLVVTGWDAAEEIETVEIVHEALIQEWRTLRNWIATNREFLIWRNRLKGRLREWKATHSNEGMLLRSLSLVEAQDWLDKRKDELSIAEIDFIDSSVALAGRELGQRELERQQNRLGIVSSFVSSLVAIILLGAALSRVSLGFELLLFLAAVTIAATAALLVAISKWRLLSLSSYRDEQLIIQDIRELKNSRNVESIRDFHRKLAINELQSPIRSLVRIFINTSKDVEAALNRESVYYQRQALRDVLERLDAQLHTLTRSTNKYATRFYVIGQEWREVLNNYVSELAETVETRQEISNPYIIGIPLNDTLRETFIERSNICLRIEQLLLDQRRPPLLLYGQRRMGKTSLLNNLERLLPNNIIPMFIDLQGASIANNFAGFLYILAKEMVKSAKKQGIILSPLTREALKDDPFTCFNEWLSEEVEQVLEENIALLMLDEFEALDSAITKGRFDEQDVLGMLRHIIQHHPQFKVLLSGSHTLEEHQRWASYLINVQVVHISYFKEDETRRLIERPIEDFALRYKPDAVERVLQLTRCHPFLVQLLCNEIVSLKNEQDPSIRRRAKLRDVEEAIPKALNSGSFFFADIQTNQVDSLGLSILRFLAAQGEGVTVSTKTLSQQFPNNVNSALKLLLQRELIEVVDDGYRFQVELIRRWFAQ